MLVAAPPKTLLHWHLCEGLRDFTGCVGRASDVYGVAMINAHED